MITSIALYFLHRALDERRPVPAVVRQLCDAHPPTARAVADVLRVHGALSDPQQHARELGQAFKVTDVSLHAHAPEPSWSRPDPAWWAAGGAMRGIAAVAAVFALAAFVAIITLSSGTGEPDPLATATPEPRPTNRVIVALPAVPNFPAVANPLKAPTRAVQTALTPVADPATALRQGFQKLGEGLEAPLRREWSAIAAQFDAMVRRSDPAPSEGAPAKPPTNVPSTLRRSPSEPRDAVAV